MWSLGLQRGDNYLNYAEIKPFDVANAKGISCTLFVSGCTHKCEGCFNLELQDFNYGQEFTKEVEDDFINKCKNPNVTTVSVLGGEPFQQPYVRMLNLFRRLKTEVNKPIWVWTGYTYVEILADERKKGLLHYIDVLIDGRFEKDLKDLKLKHRGSSNQRIINVQESLKENEVIEYDWGDDNV